MPRSAYFLVAVFLLSLVFLGTVVSMLVFPIQPALVSSGLSGKTPTVSFTLYAGEINDTLYGFGLNSSTLTSPGPTLSFKMSDIVKVTLVNVGKYPHGFTATDAPKSVSTRLFGSLINPIPSGQSASIVFQGTHVGTQFYYICPVSGHAELGMWGHVTVASG